MVVNHAAGLQMGVHGDGAQIFKAPLFQFFADRIRNVIAGSLALLVAFVYKGLSVGIAPQELVKGAVLPDNLQIGPGVCDDGLNLSGRADHSRRLHDFLNLLLIVVDDFLVVKIVEALAENLSLIQHHGPVQPALHHFHHQKLKMLPVIMNRNPPLLVVVLLIDTVVLTPFTPRNHLDFLLLSVWLEFKNILSIKLYHKIRLENIPMLFMINTLTHG